MIWTCQIVNTPILDPRGADGVQVLDLRRNGLDVPSHLLLRAGRKILRALLQPVEVDGTGVDGYFRKLLIEAIDAWIKE